jgi:hypothetical protein
MMVLQVHDFRDLYRFQIRICVSAKKEKPGGFPPGCSLSKKREVTFS